MFALLAYPFIVRALLAGILIAVLLSVLGVFVVLRKMAFFADGIAHASLAGIAFGILAGVAPLPVAILWAVIIAMIMYMVERHTRLSSDTVIGILFTASLALGVVLLSFIPGYQPELVSFLFGNILTITWNDLLALGLWSLLVLSLLFAFRRGLMFTSLDRDAAHVAGIRTTALELALYIALAVSVVFGVKLLGVILVAALLLIPPATARMLAVSLRQFFLFSLFAGLLSVLLGLLLSFMFDTPSGATIILSATALFLFSGIASKISQRS